MKILLLSPNQIKRYNWGHQLFRNEIGRQHDVLYYGDGYPNYNPKLNVQEIIKKHYKTKPDIILTYGFKYTLAFRGLGDIKNIPKVHISVDYFGKKGKFKGTLLKQNEFFKRNKPDLVFGVVSEVVDNLRNNNISDKIFLLPFCVNTNIYKVCNNNKSIDVLAAFTTRDDVYPNRNKIHKLLNRMNVTKITKRVIHKQLVNCINQSRICITSNNIFRSLSMRYTEVLSSGGFLLADKPSDFDKLGYVDGKHLIIYNGLKDLKNKIIYYLNKPKERKRISKNGTLFVRNNHSCKVRVKQFTNIIKKEIL